MTEPQHRPSAAAMSRRACTPQLPEQQVSPL